MRIAFLLLLVLATMFCSGQAGSFDVIIQTYHTQNNFNGAVLVSREGNTVFTGSAGIADRAHEIPVDSNAVFKICSITKTFTAVLILQLMEENKISLDATIGTYLKDYTGEAKNKATILHLLTYSSGIPDCESYTGEDIYQRPISRDSFITAYCSGDLISNPGTKFHYGNGEYVLLGKIIETVTGKSFEDNIRQRILEPLKMEHTGIFTAGKIVKGLVDAYLYNDSLKTFSTDAPYYIENYFSAGAMYSTVKDMLKFDQGIFTYRLLKKETVNRMVTPNPSLDNVGLGFWVAGKYGMFNSDFAYRPGGIYGSTANWIHVMDANSAIIVLSNTDATNLFEMSEKLYGAAAKQ